MAVMPARAPKFLMARVPWTLLMLLQVQMMIQMVRCLPALLVVRMLQLLPNIVSVVVEVSQAWVLRLLVPP
jgi:hypothetical protein